MIFAIDSPQFCQAPRGTDFSLCSDEEGNKPNAAVGDSHSIDELNRVSRRSVGLSISPRLSLFRAEPFNAPPSIVLTRVFSHSCELFLAPSTVEGCTSIPLRGVYSLFSYYYELFCAVQNHISFVFMQFHTLSQKHPGVGALLPARSALRGVPRSSTRGTK